MLTRSLASYPDHEEFQVERVIVWVETTGRANKSECVSKANQIFESVWAACSHAVAAAERHSRAELPDFWNQIDQVRIPQSPLTVYGIRITPDGSASYEVCENYDYPWSNILNTPELPESYSVIVVRNGDGSISVSD